MYASHHLKPILRPFGYFLSADPKEGYTKTGLTWTDNHQVCIFMAKFARCYRSFLQRNAARIGFCSTEFFGSAALLYLGCMPQTSSNHTMMRHDGPCNPVFLMILRPLWPLACMNRWTSGDTCWSVAVWQLPCSCNQPCCRRWPKNLHFHCCSGSAPKRTCGSPSFRFRCGSKAQTRV